MTHLRYEVSKIQADYRPGDWVSYQKGVDAVLSYIGCLHPETTLEDVITSVHDAIKEGII